MSTLRRHGSLEGQAIGAEGTAVLGRHAAPVDGRAQACAAATSRREDPGTPRRNTP
jgi:hypothetical protein